MKTSDTTTPENAKLEAATHAAEREAPIDRASSSMPRPPRIQWKTGKTRIAVSNGSSARAVLGG